MVAVAAGEAEDPRRNIPKAVRRVFWRILFFYVLGSWAIGVTVPANDPRLLHPGVGAAGSPWVIAIVRAGIPVLPSIINAVILTSASSSANAFLYTGSRYLFALAQNKQAPKQLLYCTKAGVPVWCVLITASIGLLTYMTVSAGAANVFSWFQTLTTITSLITWVNILVAYLGFHKALKAQGVDRSTLPMRTWGQPYTAIVPLVVFSLVLFFNGFYVFTNGNVSTHLSPQSPGIRQDANMYGYLVGRQELCHGIYPNSTLRRLLRFLEGLQTHALRQGLRSGYLVRQVCDRC